jgi:hypothetical protein
MADPLSLDDYFWQLNPYCTSPLAARIELRSQIDGDRLIVTPPLPPDGFHLRLTRRFELVIDFDVGLSKLATDYQAKIRADAVTRPIPEGLDAVFAPGRFLKPVPVLAHLPSPPGSARVRPSAAQLRAGERWREACYRDSPIIRKLIASAASARPAWVSAPEPEAPSPIDKEAQLEAQRKRMQVASTKHTDNRRTDAEKRREGIRSALTKNPRLGNKALVDLFGVSSTTLKQDLHDMGLLRRQRLSSKKAGID